MFMFQLCSLYKSSNIKLPNLSYLIKIFYELNYEIIHYFRVSNEISSKFKIQTRRIRKHSANPVKYFFFNF